MPGGNEHQGKEGGPEDQPAKLGDLAVSGKAVNERPDDSKEHGNQSDHGITPFQAKLADGEVPRESA